jgi:hypothetical protein
VRGFIPGTLENIALNRDKILATYERKPRVNDLIVSMTTYAPRIDSFEYAILSILAGSVLPERICVYIPKGFLSLLATRNSLLKSEYDKGFISLIEMEIDYFCHSKYYYSFLDYGHTKDIITGDDDVIYYKDWVKHLVESAQKYPEYDVFAYKAVDVKVVKGKIAPYDEWTHCSKNHTGENKLLFAEGVGGVLYRKGALTKEVLNKEKFLELTPKADDVWLWFCTYLNNCKIKYIVACKNKKLLYVVPDTINSALWVENTVWKRTDIYVENCHNYFLEKFDFNIINKYLKT